MKYTIVCGSSRATSQSGKIARYIQNELHTLGAKDTYLLDLANNPLPLWDESVWSDGETWVNLWNPIKSQLQSSDAFIFVVPEWGGMVPSAVKNLFLLCSAQELGHKPGYIVAISSSRGGSYPVSELRMSSYKNNRICYIPEHLVIRDVEKLFNPGAPLGEDDTYMRSRLTYGLRLLGQYASALQTVRVSGIIDHKAFPNGM